MFHVLLKDVGLILLCSEPRRDLVSPPQLSTNTPILDVIQPVEPSSFVIRWHNLQVSVSNRICGSLGHSLAIDVPLRSNHGFQNITRARAETKSHFVWLLALEQPLLLNIE